MASQDGAESPEGQGLCEAIYAAPNDTYRFAAGAVPDSAGVITFDDGARERVAASIRGEDEATLTGAEHASVKSREMVPATLALEHEAVAIA